MTRERPELRVVSGGRARGVVLRGIEIVVAPGGPPPFALDAVVIEDDTHRVLGAPVDLPPSEADLLYLVREMQDAPAAMPGCVVPKATVPLSLHAIVHDLDLEPSWSEPWVEQALRAIMVAVKDRGVRALGIPLLGTVHGNLAPERSLQLLLRVLLAVDRGPLRRLWILVPKALVDTVRSRLSALTESHQAPP